VKSSDDVKFRIRLATDMLPAQAHFSTDGLTTDGLDT